MSAYASHRAEATRSSILEGVNNPASHPAWARFFDCYAGFVFSLARQRGLRPDEADEVVQSVMIGMVQAMPDFTYDRSRGSFRGWLRRRVQWRIADQLRKREGLVPIESVPGEELVDDSPSTPDRLADAEWNDMVLSASLDRLRSAVSSEHFSIFHASVVAGWETAKVMRVYGVTRDSLYQIRKRVGVKFEAIAKAVAEELDGPVTPRAEGAPEGRPCG